MLRFDPFSDLDALTRGLLTSQTGSNRVPRFMPMDLCKIDDHYVLTADLPGVDPGSVDVNVDNGTLTISAHRTARQSSDVAPWRRPTRPSCPSPAYPTKRWPGGYGAPSNASGPAAASTTTGCGPTSRRTPTATTSGAAAHAARACPPSRKAVLRRHFRR